MTESERQTLQFHDDKLYDLQGQINALTMIVVSAVSRLADHEAINRGVWFRQISSDVKLNLDMQLGSIHAHEPSEEQRYYEVTKRHADKLLGFLQRQNDG